MYEVIRAKVGQACQRRHLVGIRRLLARLAVGVAQVGLLFIHARSHGICARHASFRCGRYFFRLGAAPRTRITRQGQLCKQQAHQCEQHCHEAVTVIAKHVY